MASVYESVASNFAENTDDVSPLIREVAPRPTQAPSRKPFTGFRTQTLPTVRSNRDLEVEREQNRQLRALADGLIGELENLRGTQALTEFVAAEQQRMGGQIAELSSRQAFESYLDGINAGVGIQGGATRGGIQRADASNAINWEAVALLVETALTGGVSAIAQNVAFEGLNRLAKTDYIPAPFEVGIEAALAAAALKKGKVFSPSALKTLAKAGTGGTAVGGVASAAGVGEGFSELGAAMLGATAVDYPLGIGFRRLPITDRGQALTEAVETISARQGPSLLARGDQGIGRFIPGAGARGGVLDPAIDFGPGRAGNVRSALGGVTERPTAIQDNFALGPGGGFARNVQSNVFGERLQDVEGNLLLAGPRRVMEYVFPNSKRFPDNVDLIRPRAIASAHTNPAYGVESQVRVEGIADPVAVRFRLVEMDDLVASHDEQTFAVNPDFPDELQPRDRSRAPLQEQVRTYAGQLDSDILLTDFKSLDRGSPGVTSENLVFSGNGRVMMLRIARRDSPDRYEAYKQDLRSRAEDLGFSPETVDSYDSPVLVRELSPNAADEAVTVQALAQASNVGTGATMGASETAVQDARLINVDLIQKFQPGSGSLGDAIRANFNQDFVREFISALPPTERAALYDANGDLSQAGVSRIQAAIFARTYGDESGARLFGRFFESSDPQVLNLMNAMSNAAPKIMQSEDLVQQGVRAKELSIVDDFTIAAEEFARIKEARESVEKRLSSLNMFEEGLSENQKAIVRMLEENTRSPRKIKAFLDTFADSVVASPNPNQAAMFGDELANPTVTYQELFERALREATQTSDNLPSTQQGTLIGREFGDTAGGTQGFDETERLKEINEANRLSGLPDVAAGTIPPADPAVLTFIEDIEGFIAKTADDVIVQMLPVGQRSSVYFVKLESLAQKKGVGTRILREIADRADEQGITIVGSAVPTGKPGPGGSVISQEKLIEFYRKVGFVFNDPEDPASMVRKPNVGILEAEYGDLSGLRPGESFEAAAARNAARNVEVEPTTPIPGLATRQDSGLAGERKIIDHPDDTHLLGREVEYTGQIETDDTGFSWYGVRQVLDDGTLNENVQHVQTPPPPPSNAAQANYKLPEDLKDSNFNWGRIELEFESDFDLAVAIASSSKPSARRATFIEEIEEVLGRKFSTQKEVKNFAAPLRDRIREIVKGRGNYIPASVRTTEPSADVAGGAARQAASDPRLETAQAGDRVTVFDPLGNPVEVTVTARSEAGNLRIRLDDGTEELLGGGTMQRGNANSPDYVLEALNNKPRVEELSDAELQSYSIRVNEKIAAHAPGNSGASASARLSFVTDLNALTLEARRRGISLTDDVSGMPTSPLVNEATETLDSEVTPPVRPQETRATGDPAVEYRESEKLSSDAEYWKDFASPRLASEPIDWDSKEFTGQVTIKRINRALKQAGYRDRLTRGPKGEGYFYFYGPDLGSVTDASNSIYVTQLQDIVDPFTKVHTSPLGLGVSPGVKGWFEEYERLFDEAFADWAEGKRWKTAGFGGQGQGVSPIELMYSQSEEFPRYFYHVRVPDDKAIEGGVDAYRTGGRQSGGPNALDDFKQHYVEGDIEINEDYLNDKYVWLSPTKAGTAQPENAVTIDVSKLKNSDLRVVNDGNFLHRGDIPRTAIVDAPENDPWWRGGADRQGVVRSKSALKSIQMAKDDGYTEFIDATDPKQTTDYEFSNYWDVGPRGDVRAGRIAIDKGDFIPNEIVFDPNPDAEFPGGWITEVSDDGSATIEFTLWGSDNFRVSSRDLEDVGGGNRSRETAKADGKPWIATGQAYYQGGRIPESPLRRSSWAQKPIPKTPSEKPSFIDLQDDREIVWDIRTTNPDYRGPSVTNTASKLLAQRAKAIREIENNEKGLITNADGDPEIALEPSAVARTFWQVNATDYRALNDWLQNATSNDFLEGSGKRGPNKSERAVNEHIEAPFVERIRLIDAGLEQAATGDIDPRTRIITGQIDESLERPSLDAPDIELPERPAEVEPVPFEDIPGERSPIIVPSVRKALLQRSKDLLEEYGDEKPGFLSRVALLLDFAKELQQGAGVRNSQESFSDRGLQGLYHSLNSIINDIDQARWYLFASQGEAKRLKIRLEKLRDTLPTPPPPAHLSPIPETRTLKIGGAEAVSAQNPNNYALPMPLSRSNVNVKFGSEATNQRVNFVSDLDRALYIATSSKPSKRRKVFEKSLREFLPEGVYIKEAADPVRRTVRAISAASPDADRLTIPPVYTEMPTPGTDTRNLNVWNPTGEPQATTKLRFPNVRGEFDATGRQVTSPVDMEAHAQRMAQDIDVPLPVPLARTPEEMPPAPVSSWTTINIHNPYAEPQATTKIRFPDVQGQFDATGRQTSWPIDMEAHAERMANPSVVQPEVDPRAFPLLDASGRPYGPLRPQMQLGQDVPLYPVKDYPQPSIQQARRMPDGSLEAIEDVSDNNKPKTIPVSQGGPNRRLGAVEGVKKQSPTESGRTDVKSREEALEEVDNEFYQQNYDSDIAVRSAAYLRTGDFNEYINAIDETRPKTVQTGLDGSSTIVPPDRIKVSAEFTADKMTETHRTLGQTSDPGRMIDAIDKGFTDGPLARGVKYVTHRIYLGSIKFRDKHIVFIHGLEDKYNIANKAQRKQAGELLEFIHESDANLPLPALKEKVERSGYLPKTDKRLTPITENEDGIFGYAQEMRRFFDTILDDKNAARRVRGQKEIEKRAYYRPWIPKYDVMTRLRRMPGGTLIPGENVKPLPEGFAERGPELPDFIDPTGPFNPRAQQRKTEGLGLFGDIETDLQKLATEYIESARKDIFYTDIIANANAHIEKLNEFGYVRSAGHIKKWVDEAYRGQVTAVGRAAEVLPAGVTQFAIGVRRRLARAVFTFNWPWNFFVQTSSIGLTVARYGARNTFKGLDYIVNPDVRRETQEKAYSLIIKRRNRGGVTFQDTASGIERHVTLGRSKIDTALDWANYLTSTIEDTLQGVSIRAAYRRGEEMGLKGEALWEFASDGGARTQSMYNLEDTVGFLRSPEVGALAPFQTFAFEVFNTVRELNLPVARNVLGRTGAYQTLGSRVPGEILDQRLKVLAKWIAAMVVTNAVADKAIDRKPWVTSSFVPFYSILTSPFTGGDPWNQTLPERYVADFTGAIKDYLEHGNIKPLRSFAIKYQVPGGTQINRVVLGIEAVAKGEVRNTKGKKLFDVKPFGDGTDWLKAYTQGVYATEGGREYLKDRSEGPFHEYTGFSIQAGGGRIGAVRRTWQYEEDWYEYHDIKSSLQERTDLKQPYSRVQYRKQNPELDAKLFITGVVTTLKSNAAREIAKNLIYQHDLLGLDPLTPGDMFRQGEIEQFIMGDLDPELLEVWENELGNLQRLENQPVPPSSNDRWWEQSSQPSQPSQPSQRFEQALPQKIPTPYPYERQFFGTDSESPASSIPQDSTNTVQQESPARQWERVSADMTADDLRALRKVWEGGFLTQNQENSLKIIHSNNQLGEPNFNAWMKRKLRQIQTNAAVSAVRV